MSDYHWPTIRAELIDLFEGELPQAPTEADVITAFEIRPRTVTTIAHQLVQQVQQGAPRPRSYWAVLRSRLAGATSHGPDITATDETERNKRIRAAANWIRNAGLHFDQATAVEDELFNEQTGLLKGFDTPSVRNELLELWQEQRPRGERAEEAHEAYMAKIVADRKRIEQAKAAAAEQLDELDDDPEPGTPAWHAKQREAA